MRILLLQVGKTNTDYLKKGIYDYIKRIERYISFSVKTLQESKAQKSTNTEKLKNTEADRILKEVKPGDLVILLDEHGKNYTSIEFAEFLEKEFIKSNKRLVFIIGGAYGFSKKVYDKANLKIALSKMTFSHQMARLLFVEQLYRAFTIIKGEPYHHI